MSQNFTITSPSVKIILLLCIGIYIIVYGFNVAHNIGVSRSIDVADQTPGGIVNINQVRYPSAYQIHQARIKYTVQDPLEYLLLNSGEARESLIIYALKLVIGVLSWVLLWKFDFANPFNPLFFIRAYTIFRLLIAMFVLDYVAFSYSSYCMGSFLHGDFHYVNASNGGYWFQTIVGIVIMYMYGNAVKNRQEIDLTI